jgi:hypothetical protein
MFGRISTENTHDAASSPQQISDAVINQVIICSTLPTTMPYVGAGCCFHFDKQQRFVLTD